MRKTISKWGVCYWCGTTDGPFEADHVFPASLMEDNNVQNLVCSCRKCNREKGNKRPSAWSIGGLFKFRDPEEAEEVDEYYEDSLCRYKKLTPRGYKLFIAKKAWKCKSIIEGLNTSLEPCDHWEYEHGAWQCSECGEDNPYGIYYYTTRFSNYCPSCGSPMCVKESDL